MAELVDFEMDATADTCPRLSLFRPHRESIFPTGQTGSLVENMAE
jgi:hypothetical protein